MIAAAPLNDPAGAGREPIECRGYILTPIY
jgi:hypothetical protein